MKVLCVNVREKEEDFKKLIADILFKGMDDCGVDPDEPLKISCISDINMILPRINEEEFDCVITIEKTNETSLGVKTIKAIIDITNLVLVSKDGNVSYSKRKNMFEAGFYNLIYLDRGHDDTEFYQIVANGRNIDDARRYFGIEQKESNEGKNQRSIVFDDNNKEPNMKSDELPSAKEVVEDVLEIDEPNKTFHKDLKVPAAKSALGVISFIDKNSIIIDMPEELREMDKTSFVITVTAIN